MSKVYRCSRCGYEEKFWSGIGKLYPKIYDERVEKAKSGEYGEELARLFAEIPDGWLDISYKTYVCPECGSYVHTNTLDFYESEYTGPVHQIRRVPKCETCGCERVRTDMDTAEIPPALKCPKCGGEMKYFTEIMID